MRQETVKMSPILWHIYYIDNSHGFHCLLVTF